MKLWLIVAYLLFVQQEYNWKQQEHGGRVVYVIEQTDQFQKFGKKLTRKYEFKKNKKKSDLNRKIWFFVVFCKNHDFFPISNPGKMAVRIVCLCGLSCENAREHV